MIQYKTNFKELTPFLLQINTEEERERFMEVLEHNKYKNKCICIIKKKPLPTVLHIGEDKYINNVSKLYSGAWEYVDTNIAGNDFWDYSKCTRYYNIREFEKDYIEKIENEQKEDNKENNNKPIILYNKAINKKEILNNIDFIFEIDKKNNPLKVDKGDLIIISNGISYYLDGFVGAFYKNAEDYLNCNISVKCHEVKFAKKREAKAGEYVLKINEQPLYIVLEDYIDYDNDKSIDNNSKYYNGKVCCVDSYTRQFTKGKIYNISNGVLQGEYGILREIINIDNLNQRVPSEFIKVIE